MSKQDEEVLEAIKSFLIVGETLDEIGKCVAFIKDIEAYAGGDIVIFHPIKVNSVFLSYILNSDYITRYRRKPIKTRKGFGAPWY